MTDGSQFIDIILFAMVALFLGLRLRSVLGRRTGTEKPPAEIGLAARPGPDNNVVDIAQRRRPDAAPIDDGAVPLTGALLQIHQADRNFTPEGFLQGARAAFEMIVSAFARGDKEGLRPLLSDEVFENFRRAIDARTQAGETCQSELLSITSADIEDSRLEDQKATLSVRFVSQQIIVVKDPEGKVVEGDPSRSVKIIDLWSFQRDTRAANPNWLLVATRSLEE
ncbi:Tim44/TimA family putative adaptor protein [Telmatospirillum siberiense]|uniref:Translocase n=1 Tax=Telmatospirillum siberiense TaxID=382514 RepID=A0A2N3PN16_9PROT|nr:Tim44/TimA family putative adaptor protein [Telmatospirillum siberiense]PKU21795.1 translocase [Telmatospirillum siberiense]